MVIMKIMKIK